MCRPQGHKGKRSGLSERLREHVKADPTPPPVPELRGEGEATGNFLGLMLQEGSGDGPFSKCLSSPPPWSGLRGMRTDKSLSLTLQELFQGGEVRVRQV